MTLRDVQLILPTLAILLLTVVIILTVIPYAFSSVLRQMEAVRALEAAGAQPLHNIAEHNLRKAPLL